jgi:hypothetical protein
MPVGSRIQGYAKSRNVHIIASRVLINAPFGEKGRAWAGPAAFLKTLLSPRSKMSLEIIS